MNTILSFTDVVLFIEYFTPTSHNNEHISSSSSRTSPTCNYEGIVEIIVIENVSLFFCSHLLHLMKVFKCIHRGKTIFCFEITSIIPVQGIHYRLKGFTLNFWPSTTTQTRRLLEINQDKKKKKSSLRPVYSFPDVQNFPDKRL